MKQKLRIVALSLTLLSSAAKSSVCLMEETPTPVSNKLSGISAERLQNELKTLKDGITELKKGSYKPALDHFRSALGDYGSPLGYLYGAFLESDAETARRYWRIADLARQQSAISNSHFLKHQLWLKDLIRQRG